MVHAGTLWQGEFPGVVRNQPHDAGNPSVIRIPQRQNIVVACVQPRHGNRQIIRLAAAVDEVGHLQPIRHLPRQLFGQLTHQRVQIDRSGVLQTLELCLGARDHPGMTMTAGDSDDPRQQIQIAPSGFVKDILHVPLHQHQRVLIISEDSRVAVLLPRLDHLLLGWTIINPRNMITRGHLQLFDLNFAQDSHSPFCR